MKSSKDTPVAALLTSAHRSFISRDHGAAAQLLCALVTRAATGVPASFLQNKNVGNFNFNSK